MIKVPIAQVSLENVFVQRKASLVITVKDVILVDFIMVIQPIKDHVSVIHLLYHINNIKLTFLSQTHSFILLSNFR